MLIVNVKPDESIDKALKRLKKKYKNAQIVQQLRERQQFTKPSVKRRKEIIKAKYKEQMRNQEG
jgi:small subunit ribosomal protein S21